MAERLNSLVKDEKAFVNTIWLILALLLGTAVRLNFISGTKFPINDGGLFYQMVNDLLENNLGLPQYTFYNQEQIPYAYPPLAFYLIAGLKSLLQISLFSLLRYVPLLISGGTILVFYFLAKEIVKESFLPGVAAMFFALTPRTFEWFVMGGGITRALGFFFAIMAIHAIWQLFDGKKGNSVALRAALWSGLTVLSHPETALFVVFTAFVLILYHGISKENILKGLWVAAGVSVIISPWIVRVILYHGIEPFMSAGATGHELWFEIKNIITLKFGFDNGEFLSITTGLALLAVISRRDKLTWTLFGMLLIGYLFFPRSGPNLLTIWVSILAALGFGKLIFLSSKSDPQEVSLYKVLADNNKTKILLILTVVYLLLGAYTYKYIYGKSELHLTNEIHDAFVWLEKNSEQDELFLIYPSIESNRFWWNDYLAEWFPVISNRKSVSTVQGSEWIPEIFEQKIDSYVQLRSCNEPGPVCVEKWEKTNGQRVNYIVIDTKDNRPDFINSFKMDLKYQQFYESERLIVYKKTVESSPE